MSLDKKYLVDGKEYNSDEWYSLLSHFKANMSSLKKNIKIFSVSGNIGAGKSTIINLLREYFLKCKFVVFVDEPIEEWLAFKCDNDKSLVHNFYENKTEYAFDFQLNAMVSRMKKLKNSIVQNPEGIVFIMERSCDDDYNIFLKLLQEEGFIKNYQVQMYKQFLDSIFDDFQINLYIIIQTSVDICMQRIEKRSRDCEKGIPFDYLYKLQEKMDTWMNGLDNKLIINFDNDIGDIKLSKELEKIISKIYTEFFNCVENDTF